MSNGRGITSKYNVIMKYFIEDILYYKNMERALPIKNKCKKAKVEIGTTMIKHDFRKMLLYVFGINFCSVVIQNVKVILSEGIKESSIKDDLSIEVAYQFVCVIH